MGVESAADRAAFLNPEEFGETATWTRVGSHPPASIEGVFTNEFRRELDEVTDGGIGSPVPVFIVSSADVTLAGPGDRLEISSVLYRIAEVEPDGTGMTILWLEKRNR
ncbi:MAG: hypothetical protein QNJ62_06525 [Methyloceanibacter sp.]|nr:hypothetical protein [Methyloceanibacter sp.]